MTSVGAHEGAARWLMLAMVSLGIVALTLNWFDVATAFPLIGAEFKVGRSASLSRCTSLATGSCTSREVCSPRRSA
jgi:hypothetical protein